ncbi:MAG TPA: hypothetical protein PKZ84_09085 [Anaerolineae bacterium]|nr:hypothetical protein [Anaerolineae bacterium]HQI84623.1 hypothetical protein [Anaerolineae bacterium]
MLSPYVIETLKPLVRRLTPGQRFELIRWIVNEAPSTETAPPPAEPALETSDANTLWETRISAEAALWYARSDTDRAPYLGEYVAVLKGQVVDHDPDRRALAIRIRRQYPGTPVLITEAEARQPHEFLILSPRFERMETTYESTL